MSNDNDLNNKNSINESTLGADLPVEISLVANIITLAICEYRTAENIEEKISGTRWQELTNDYHKLYIDRVLRFIGIFPGEYWKYFYEFRQNGTSDKLRELLIKHNAIIENLLLYIKDGSYEVEKAKLMRLHWKLQPAKKRLLDDGVRFDVISNKKRHLPCEKTWGLQDDL